MTSQMPQREGSATFPFGLHFIGIGQCPSGFSGENPLFTAELEQQSEENPTDICSDSVVNSRFSLEKRQDKKNPKYLDMNLEIQDLCLESMAHGW